MEHYPNPLYLRTFDIWLLTTTLGLCRVAIDSGVPKSGCGRGRGQGRGRSTSHACRVCSKTFTSEVYLKAHEQSHAKAEVDVDDTRKVQQARFGVRLLDVRKTFSVRVLYVFLTSFSCGVCTLWVRNSINVEILQS